MSSDGQRQGGDDVGGGGEGGQTHAGEAGGRRAPGPRPRHLHRVPGGQAGAAHHGPQAAGGGGRQQQAGGPRDRGHRQWQDHPGGPVSAGGGCT